MSATVAHSRGGGGLGSRQACPFALRGPDGWSPPLRASGRIGQRFMQWMRRRSSFLKGPLPHLMQIKVAAVAACRRFRPRPRIMGSGGPSVLSKQSSSDLPRADSPANDAPAADTPALEASSRESLADGMSGALRSPTKTTSSSASPFGARELPPAVLARPPRGGGALSNASLSLCAGGGGGGGASFFSAEPWRSFMRCAPRCAPRATKARRPARGSSGPLAQTPAAPQALAPPGRSGHSRAAWSRRLAESKKGPRPHSPHTPPALCAPAPAPPPPPAPPAAGDGIAPSPAPPA